MRELSPPVGAACAAAAVEPIQILSITRGGVTRHFSDRALAEPLACEALLVRCTTPDDTPGIAGPRPGTAVLADPFGAVRVWLDTPGRAEARAELSLLFAGPGTAQPVLLAEGHAATDALWAEDTGTLTVSLTWERSVARNPLIGTIVSAALFPGANPAECGRMLPIVYGHARRVEAVPVTMQAATTLALPCSDTVSRMIVTDARDFPAGPVLVRLGGELIRGAFDGNVFTVSARPAAFAEGVARASASRRIIAATLPAAAHNAFAGLVVSLEMDGRRQHRTIVRSDDGMLWIDRPFTGSSGDAEAVPDGTAFRVQACPAAHGAGTAITLVPESTVYVVADHATAGIELIEGWGRITESVRVDGIVGESSQVGFVPLSMDLCAVNTADTTTAPALGRPITTITLARPPTSVAGGLFLDDRLFVTVRGAVGQEGLIETPAAVMRELSIRHGGVAAEAWSDADVAAADAARPHVRAGFALTRARPLWAILSDMATQAALELRWQNGCIRPQALSNALGETVFTLDGDMLEAGGATVSDTAEEELVTEVAVAYRAGSDTAAIAIRDEEACALHGPRRLALDGWMLADRTSARWVAEFWLRRLRHRYRLFSITAFHAGLPVETGDVVLLSRPDWPGGAVRGRVQAAQFDPGAIADGAPPRLRTTVRASVWAGCASACEHVCETGQCESAGCELSCTGAAETACTWTCESSCQSVCELGCTGSCETACMTYCQTGREEDSACTTACETGCETGSCQTDASETGCSFQCQTAAVESVREIRQVRVQTAASVPLGDGTAVQVDSNGHTFGDSFTVLDPFNVHPAAASSATAYLNHHDQWVYVPSEREVKLVRIEGDNGPRRARGRCVAFLAGTGSDGINSASAPYWRRMAPRGAGRTGCGSNASGRASGQR